eukprot:scaffold135146_cov66-Phaeocystis_antarctica.AAC.5
MRRFGRDPVDGCSAVELHQHPSVVVPRCAVRTIRPRLTRAQYTYRCASSGPSCPVPLVRTVRRLRDVRCSTDIHSRIPASSPNRSLCAATSQDGEALHDGGSAVVGALICGGKCSAPRRLAAREPRVRKAATRAKGGEGRTLRRQSTLF